MQSNGPDVRFALVQICPQRPELLATQADTGKVLSGCAPLSGSSAVLGSSRCCVFALCQVHLWNVKPQLDALDKPPTTRLEKPKPAFTYSGQLAEGYCLLSSALLLQWVVQSQRKLTDLPSTLRFAMDWSIQQPGVLATGTRHDLPSVAHRLSIGRRLQGRDSLVSAQGGRF